MEIIPLHRDHIRDVCAVCRQALRAPDFFAPEDLRHTILRDPCQDERCTLAAKVDGEIVGILNGALREMAEERKRGLVKLFAVRPSHQRQGVATALFDRFEQLCRDEGAESITVGSIGPLYFFAGVDPQYTEAVIFLMQRGYEKAGDSFYLGVDLGEPLPRYEALIRELADSGITSDRPDHEEREHVREWVRAVFGDGWAHETDLGFSNEVVSVWVARAEGSLCGFATSNATGRDYFGPIGTAAEHRQKGIGRVLVVKCLEDMQRDGRSIAWIPTGLARIPFYHQAAGARVRRTFWPFAKKL